MIIKTISRFDKEFKRLNKKYKSLLADLRLLRNELEANPYIGADLGKGVRKVRMAITAKGKGKSHGARVITYTDAIISISEGELYLLTIYDQAEQSTITDKEIEDLLKNLPE